VADEPHAVRDKARLPSRQPLHQRLDCRIDLGTLSGSAYAFARRDGIAYPPPTISIEE
jgi:hypothetical protein